MVHNQENPTLEKLDRILVSKDWEDIFPNTSVKKLPREISDHNPLILYSESYKPTMHIQFRYELSWVNNPEFIAAIKKIWSKPRRAKTMLDKIQQKLNLFNTLRDGVLTCKEN